MDFFPSDAVQQAIAANRREAAKLKQSDDGNAEFQLGPWLVNAGLEIGRPFGLAALSAVCS
jgi:hypothetical protein